MGRVAVEEEEVLYRDLDVRQAMGLTIGLGRLPGSIAPVPRRIDRKQS